MPRKQLAEGEISLASVPVKDRGTTLDPEEVLLLRTTATSPSSALLSSIFLECTFPSVHKIHRLYADDLYSAHIDTTGVQTLIDTRSELERWADGPVEVRVTYCYLVKC